MIDIDIIIIIYIILYMYIQCHDIVSNLIADYNL